MTHVPIHLQRNLTGSSTPQPASPADQLPPSSTPTANPPAITASQLEAIVQAVAIRIRQASSE